jgi:hypothetical protein
MSPFTLICAIGNHNSPAKTIWNSGSQLHILSWTGSYGTTGADGVYGTTGADGEYGTTGADGDYGTTGVYGTA